MAFKGLLTDTTPKISWTYFDPDGDPQESFQIQIDRASTFDSNLGSPDYDSGVINSPNPYHTISALAVRGLLYFRIKVKDNQGNWSSWSGPDTFVLDTNAEGITDDTPRIKFTGGTDPDGNSLHYQVQMSTYPNFLSGVMLDKNSSLDQTGWEYWNGISWNAIPSAGVPNGYAGNEIRYQVQSADAFSDLYCGSLFVRIRSYDGTDYSTWTDPIAGYDYSYPDNHITPKLWSRLGSDLDITSPVVGVGGTPMNGPTYTTGKFGNGVDLR